jgi:hypothetical protein
MLETMNLGMPKGSAFMTVVAEVVFEAPPNEMIPPNRPWASNWCTRVIAPRIMMGVTSPVFLEARIAWIFPPPASATSSDEMSGGMVGSPPIEVSMRSALNPRASIRSLRYWASLPLVSRVLRMRMCLVMK